MPANKPHPPVTAKPWAIEAACATPAGIALIDLLVDQPSTWEDCHIRKRIRTLCDACPVKPQCRRQGEELVGILTKTDINAAQIPYAGHPLKHYRQENTA